MMLRHYRTLAKMSQDDLADATDLTQATISAIERGGDTCTANALKIVNALKKRKVKCTIEQVFCQQNA